MLGIISAFDKILLTIGTGNKEMYPILLSLANINPGVYMKATSYSFVLSAYLSIPKFISITPPVQAALAADVYHSCLTIETESLQSASQEGVQLSDLLGHTCVCYPALVS